MLPHRFTTLCFVCAVQTLSGCIAVTVPPQSPMGPYVPLGDPGETTGTISGEAVLWPGATGNLQLPTDFGAIELGGQVSATSFAATPALWVREVDEETNVRRAYRIGFATGAGDLLGIYPFEMPYLGGSFHFQTTRPKPKHLATTTIGASFMAPVEWGEEIETPDGFVVVMLPSVWINGRWSWGWPVTGGDHIVLSAGFDLEIGLVGLSLLITPIIPVPAMGLAYQFGAPE